MKYTFSSSLLATVLFNGVLLAATIQNAASQRCDDKVLMRCAQPLSGVGASTDMGFVSTKEELDLLCPRLNSGIKCVNKYINECLPPEKRLHFTRMYMGTSMATQELCEEGPYQQEFLRHAPCMQQVKKEYEYCSKLYAKVIQDKNMNGGNNGSKEQEAANVSMRTICCSLQDYLRCSENIVMERCGEETAKFTHNYLARMSSSLITEHCVPYLPSCLDAISGAFSSSEVLLSNWLLLVLVNFAFLLNIFKSRT